MKLLEVFGWLSLVFGFLLLIGLFSGNVGAWSSTTFNNSLGSENITLIGDNVPSWTSSTGNRTYPFTNSYDYNYNTYTEISHSAVVYYNFTGIANGITIKMMGYTGVGGSTLECYSGSSWYGVSLSAFSNVNPSESSVSLPLNCRSISTVLRFTGGTLEGQYDRLYEINQGTRGFRYLSIPSSVAVLTKGYLNLSGYNLSGEKVLTTSYESSAYALGSVGQEYLTSFGMNWTATASFSLMAFAFNLSSDTILDYGEFCGVYSSLNTGAASLLSSGTIVNEVCILNSSYAVTIGTNYWLFRSAPAVNFKYTGGNEYINGCPMECDGWNINCIYKFGTCGGDLGYVIYTNSYFNSNLTNVSLYAGNFQVWNYSGTFNQLNNRTINFATYINNYLSTCSYVSGYCLVPFLFHSDTSGILRYSDMSFDNIGFIENSQTYNPTTFVSSTENFILNATYDTSSYISTGTLYYNGTAYSSTKTTTGIIGNVLFSSSVPISSVGTFPFYWQVALTNLTGSTAYYNSTNRTQAVTGINFQICNSTMNVSYINFTFKDEATGDYMNASADLTTWSYWVGSASSSAGAYIFSNITSNPNYDFCFNPPDKTINVVLQYFQYSYTGYPQRHYYLSRSLTNATTTKVLYLLSTASGIYSTFQVVGISGSPISGVTVQAERQLGGVWVLIEQGTTDSSGLVTFWLNPNYDHRLIVSKIGYTSSIQTIRPTQSIYTIILGGGAISNGTYYSEIEGISYTKTPMSGIINPGVVKFTYNITSSKSNIVACKFEITNSTSVLESSQVVCTSNAYLTITRVVAAGDNLYGKYYVDMGGGYLLLEGDSNWKVIPTVVSQGSLRKLLQFISNPNIWTDGTELENQRYEYTKFVAIFLIIALIAAAGNIAFSYDIINPGVFLFGLVFLIWIMSIGNGVAGPGLFYMKGATILPFMDNYLIPVYATLIAAGFYFATMRREQ